MFQLYHWSPKLRWWHRALIAALVVLLSGVELGSALVARVKRLFVIVSRKGGRGAATKPKLEAVSSTVGETPEKPLGRTGTSDSG